MSSGLIEFLAEFSLIRGLPLGLTCEKCWLYKPRDWVSRELQAIHWHHVLGYTDQEQRSVGEEELVPASARDTNICTKSVVATIHAHKSSHLCRITGTVCCTKEDASAHAAAVNAMVNASVTITSRLGKALPALERKQREKVPLCFRKVSLHTKQTGTSLMGKTIKGSFAKAMERLHFLTGKKANAC